MDIKVEGFRYEDMTKHKFVILAAEKKYAVDMCVQFSYIEPITCAKA